MQWPRWPTGRSHWQVDRRVSLGRSRLVLHWMDKILTRTFFNQYSTKYIKMIHQLVGHVYSLVSLVMADRRLAGQMPCRCCNMFFYYCVESWFRRNRHFAFCLCITYWGDGTLDCICTCDTQLWHFAFVATLPTGRSRVIKKFSSRSQSKTSWPPMK